MGDISVGAVGAAFVAALASLLGLIISKEQKTSEFRQIWVDSLRSEITAYLSNLNGIVDGAKVQYDTHADKVKALSPLYTKLNEAAFSIALRINPKEDRSKALMAAMVEVNQLSSDESKLTPSNIRPIETRLLTAAQELLKFEWKRVKRGEPTFIIAKLASLLMIISAILYGAVLLHREPTQTPVPAKTLAPSTEKNLAAPQIEVAPEKGVPARAIEEQQSSAPVVQKPAIGR